MIVKRRNRAPQRHSTSEDKGRGSVNEMFVSFLQKQGREMARGAQNGLFFCSPASSRMLLGHHRCLEQAEPSVNGAFESSAEPHGARRPRRKSLLTKPIVRLCLFIYCCWLIQTNISEQMESFLLFKCSALFILCIPAVTA